MNDPRQDFLAGPALALDEHGDVRPGDFFYGLPRLFHGRGHSEDLLLGREISARIPVATNGLNVFDHQSPLERIRHLVLAILLPNCTLRPLDEPATRPIGKPRLFFHKPLRTL